MFPVEKLTNIVNQLQHKSVTSDYFACLSLILQLIGLVIGPILIVIGFYVGLYLIKKKLISTLDKDAPINIMLRYSSYADSPKKWYIDGITCSGHPKQKILNVITYIYWGLIIASALLLISPFFFMNVSFFCVVCAFLFVTSVVLSSFRLTIDGWPFYTHAQRYKDTIIHKGNMYIDSLSWGKRTISEKKFPALIDEVEEWIGKVRY